MYIESRAYGVKKRSKTINSDQFRQKDEKSRKFRLTPLNICATNRLWRFKNGDSDTKSAPKRVPGKGHFTRMYKRLAAHQGDDPPHAR